MVAKKRADEARSLQLQGSWFTSVIRRMLIMASGKEGGEMPRCMTKLAAALHKVLQSGFPSFVACCLNPFPSPPISPPGVKGIMHSVLRDVLRYPGGVGLAGHTNSSFVFRRKNLCRCFL